MKISETFIMKKLFVIAGILMCSYCISGQGTIDYLLKAKALTSDGKPDMAIKELTDAIGSASDHRLYLERAEASIIKGDYSAAIRDFNEANRIAAASGEYGLSRIYALKGDVSTSLYHLDLNIGSSFRKSERDILL